MPTDSGAKVRWPRVLEAILIALIAGALSGYISVSKMEVKIEYLEKQVCKIEQRLDSMFSAQPYKFSRDRDENVRRKIPRSGEDD